MASTTRAAAADNPDALFFLSILNHIAPDGKPNWAAVAADVGQKYAKNVPTKFNSVAKKYGYKYERGSFISFSETTAGDDATAAASPGGVTTPTTPTGTAVPKTPRRKKAAVTTKKAVDDVTTPIHSAKKRKVDEVAVYDEAEEDREPDLDNQD